MVTTVGNGDFELNHPICTDTHYVKYNQVQNKVSAPSSKQLIKLPFWPFCDCMTGFKVAIWQNGLDLAGRASDEVK